MLYAKTSEDIAGGGALFNCFRYEQKQWLITPVIACRAIEDSRYHLGLFAGMQIMSLSSDITGRFASGGQTEAGRDLSFVDPIIGLRGQAELGDAFFLRYHGQVGASAPAPSSPGRPSSVWDITSAKIRMWRSAIAAWESTITRTRLSWTRPPTGRSSGLN